MCVGRNEEVTWPKVASLNHGSGNLGIVLVLSLTNLGEVTSLDSLGLDVFICTLDY